jgi:hypothetical protein
MKRTSTVVSALVIALSATAFGCSKDDDKKGPATREEADEVSGDEGQSGEVRAMADAVALVKGETPNGMSLSSTGAFEFNRGGLKYSYNVSCFDAAGATVTCGPSADGGTLTVNWDGTYDGIWVDGSALRAGEWTLRGVQGNNPVLSGQGSFDLSIEYNSLDGRRRSSYDFSFDATYVDVRFDRSLGRPVGGTITYEVEATRTASGPNRDANAQFDATAVVTFSPDGASLSVDKDFNYDIDLKKGQANPRDTSAP